MKTASTAADTYDTIAEDFTATRGTLTVWHIVNGTMGDLIGDATGLDAIDLATGDGQWARHLKIRGAASVLGVDVSPEMIRLARDAEAKTPMGCDYVQADVAGFKTDRLFDLATAGFLLNYAASRQDLVALRSSVRRLLKPGARFVGINVNMFLNMYDFDDWTSVGRYMSGPAEPQEGDALTIRLKDESGRDVAFDNYYLNPETYDSVFAETGFSSFRWVLPTVSDEGYAVFDNAFWQNLLDRPQLIGFEAVA